MPAAATSELMAPDEFAELLDTPDFLAMPAHERAAVFDAGLKDSGDWLRANGVDDEAAWNETALALGTRYRPAQRDIETSQQGPLGTAVNAFRNLGPEVVGGAVGGIARIADAGAEMIGLSDPKQKSWMDSVAGFSDRVIEEGQLLRPTNPANPTAATIGGGAGQAVGILGTMGAGLVAQVPRAAVAIPAALGFSMGANEGIQTAEEMGIDSGAGKLGMGAGFGAIEGATEMIGGIGGKLLPVAQGVKGALKSMAVEAGEEVLAGRMQDALTFGAGQAVEDPNNPGFTETGYKLPAFDADMWERTKQEAIGGAAGGAVFSGINALAGRAPAPPADATPATATPAPGQSPESPTGEDWSQRNESASPEENEALPPDQSWIAHWEPIETALGTLAPVGGGNVIADYGIERTPEYQAQVDAETSQREGLEGMARGLQNRAGNGRPMIPDSPLGGRDILDFINEHPLNVPRKGTEGGRGGEYDWSQGFEMPAYYRKFLVSSTRGYKPDQLAQMAYDEGLIRENTPDALVNAMQETMRTRTQYKAEFRARSKDLKQQEQQAVRFDKSQQKLAGKTTLPFEDLMPGDEFTIDGEPVKIRKIEHDEDGYLTEVVIEDGKAFGVLSLDPQTRRGMLVDKIGGKTRVSQQDVETGSGGVEEMSNALPEPVDAQQAKRFLEEVGWQGANTRLAEAYKATVKPAADAQAAAQARRAEIEDQLPPGWSTVELTNEPGYDRYRWKAIRDEHGNDVAWPMSQDEYLERAWREFGTENRPDAASDPVYQALKEEAERTAELRAAASQAWTSIGEHPRTGEWNAAREAEQLAAANRRAAVAKGRRTRAAKKTPSETFDDGVAFNIHQAQLPRPQTPIGPINAPGELVTLKQIRDFLLAALKLPRVGVRRYKERALGLYKIKPEMIRQLARNDLPTLAHEIGHAIHFRYLSPYRGGPAESWGGRFDSELMPLGRVTSRRSYTPDQVRMEGVAEFTRLWLLDPAAAMQQAPQFAQQWSLEMRALQPQVWEALEAARRMISQYIAQPGWERAKAHVVFDADAQRPKSTWGDYFKSAYAKWFNTLQPAYDALRAIGKADTGLAAEAMSVRERMENHRGGHQSKAHADIALAQTDLNGKIIGASLKNILSGIHPSQHADFSVYLVLKRALELRGRRIKTGLEDALANITTAEMKHFEKLFEPTRQKLLRFQENTLQMMVQSGLLSAKSAQAMRDANKDYVPFYRLYEKLHGIDTGSKAARNAGGVVDVGTGIRGIKGSDLAIVDPLQSIIRNTFVFRKLAEQNQIGVAFFGLVGKMQGHGMFADSIVPKRVPTKVSHAAVVEKLIEAGVIQDANDVDTDLSITLWQALQTPDSKNGEVIVRENGEARHWEVTDPLLYNALKSADADAAHLFQNSPFLRAFFTIPARLVRFTATAGNPIFALKNWFRDQIIAGINTQTGFIPFWDGVRGAMKVITNHPDYAAWVMSGGKFSGLNASDKTYQAMVNELLPPDKNARLAIRAMRSLRHVKKALTITSEILEEATRVQEFSRARAQGMNPMEAANLSKAVSMNFARAGHMARTLNMVIPFFNAGLQDIDMIMRQLADPKRRGRALTAAFVLISIPSLLAWALGKDDEEIQALPDWRKTQFWNFNLGPLAKLTGRPAFILSLPKPFLMGQAFGTSIERSLDQATGRDPNGAKKAALSILENTALHGDVTDFIPAALKPLVQLAFNRDTFRGLDIVPEHMQHLDKSEQVTALTSKTAQALGAMTGSSPMVIDHLLRSYLTGLGNLSSDAIDYTVTKMTEGDRNPGPASDLFEWQPFRSFVGSPYAADGNVSRFYDAASDMEARLKAWRDKAPTLDLTNASEAAWWKKHSGEVMHYQQIVNPDTSLTQAGRIRQMMQHMSNLNKAMKTTQTDATMDAATKRSTLIELSRARNASAKAGWMLFPEAVRKRHY